MNDTIQRVAMGVEYDGHSFHGWQRQHHAISVQETLETALSQVAAEPIKIVAAGRTDAGVHATQQVIHFESSANRSERAWVLGTNTALKKPVRILWARPVPSHFSARWSALSRRYRYMVYNHPIRPSLFRTMAGWYYRKLDVQKMRTAAAHWIGDHDFSSFRASECQSKTPVRHIKEITLQQLDEHWISIEFEANAFLHHMVRNMMGVLWKIGAGDASTDWAKEVLLARDRRMAGITAPPYGLYLIAVRYPEEFALPTSNGISFLVANGAASSVNC